MALDPRIALGVQPFQLPNPIEQQMQVLQLRDLQSQQRARQQEQQAKIDQQRAAEQLRAIVGKYGGLVRDGKPNEQALAEVDGIDPGLGLHIRTELSKALPKPAEPYTLGEGQIRFDGAGNEIARGPDKPVPPTPRDTRSMQARYADALASGDQASADQILSVIRQTAQAGQVPKDPEPQTLAQMHAAAVAKGDTAEAQRILTAMRAAAGAGRAPEQASYQWAKDQATGKVRPMTWEEIRRTGAGQPDTADMRNKQAGKETAALAIDAVRKLGDGIFTHVGPAQRAMAIERGVEAVFGTDPEFRTYQDARMALAGTLAVEQQGSRVSDADVRALWLPMVPDAYRDTKESYKLKWDLINKMRGVKDSSPMPDVLFQSMTGVSGQRPASTQPATAKKNPFR